MIKPFSDESVGVVGGTYKTKNPNSLIARYIGYDIEFRHSKFENDIDFAGSYSVGFRKDVFFKAGMFSREYEEANAEDNELSYRVIDLGERIVYAPNAIVTHPHPDSIKKMFIQQKSRAKWRVKLFQRNKNHKMDKYTGSQQ